MAIRKESSVWGVPLTIGILWIVGGAFALAASVATSLVSVMFIGVLLMVVGLLEMVSAFRIRSTGPFLVYLLAGILAIIVGGAFLYKPLASLATVTLVIAAYVFASGLFRGISAALERYPQWGWDLAYGFGAIMLGLYIAAAWPIASLWVLGTIVSLEIMMRGIAMVAGAWLVRDTLHGRTPSGYAPAA